MIPVLNNKHQGFTSEKDTLIREDNDRSISWERKNDKDAKNSYNPSKFNLD